MNKNAYLNAVLAALYIAVLVLIIQYAIVPGDKPGEIIVPIIMLSLFVLSASVMGYFFILQPLILLIEGKKDRAIRFFLNTVGTFAVITLALILAAYIS